MDLNGTIEIYDWTDQQTGLVLRVAQYDPALTAKLQALWAVAELRPGVRLQLDVFNAKVLKQMDLVFEALPDEAPLYHWVRAMKQQNRLSFEDGEYNIPDRLAACIVRCPGARHFVRLLGQG